jgi:general secretion pathway protein H
MLLPRWRSSIRRAKERAMTLIEVLIVMALIAIIMGAMVVGSGQLSSSRLRHSSTMLTGAIRVGFSRATATSKTVRLVMDFGENAIWLEEGDQPHLVQSKDVTGTGGASPATVAEQQALDESSRILKGPPIPKATFREIDAMGVAASEPGKGHKALDRGIELRSVQSQHDDTPRTEGRAYLYFWPGGMTERSAIQLRVGKSEEASSTVTLVVQPLTGRVTVKDGPVEMPSPKDDKEASEREDPGAF